MALFCETCNIGVSSEVTMRDHVKGRRHQQAVAAVEKRKAAAKCSLYCRDFPPSTSETALRQYFSQFGNITRIMLDRMKASYCILHFDNEAAVERALAHTDHWLAGCRLTVRPRKPINPQDHSQRLERRNHYLRSKAAALEEEEAVRQREHQQLMHTMLQMSSVTDQMEILQQTMQLSPQEVQRRHDVCQYLHHVLLPFFPTCTLHQFGSSANGFGMHGCDMDVFVDFHDSEVSAEAEEEIRKKFLPVELPHIRDLKSLEGTTKGPLLPSQLRRMPLTERARLLARILTSHGSGCGDVVYVPSNRCPIARFLHLQSGIKCDMSVNNRLGLTNTRFLRMCAEDQRVRQLMFAVRYWGKWRQVAGNVSSGPRLSNYCLSLLVYFYLANTDPPCLPTVQQMADMAGPEEQCSVEGWDCSLPAMLCPTANTQSTDELLRGFFQFYSEINLAQSVLKMRSATVLPLEQLLAFRKDDLVLKDFKIKSLAVQDPFVLSHNIALNVNGRVLDLLIHEIQAAARKGTSWTPEIASVGKSYSFWGLPYLFSSTDCQMPASEPSSQPVLEESGSQPSLLPKPKQQSVSVSLDLATVSPQFSAWLFAKGDYKAAWLHKVHELLLVALREVFLFDVQTEDGQAETEHGSVPQATGGVEGNAGPGISGPEKGCVQQSSHGSGTGHDGDMDSAGSSASGSMPEDAAPHPAPLLLSPPQNSGHCDTSPSGNSQISPRSPKPSLLRSPDNKAKRQRQASDCVSAFSGSKRIRCGDGSDMPSSFVPRGHSPSGLVWESGQRNPPRGNATCNNPPVSQDGAHLAFRPSSISTVTEGPRAASKLRPRKTDAAAASCFPPLSFTPSVVLVDTLSSHMGIASSSGLTAHVCPESPSSGSSVSFPDSSTVQNTPHPHTVTPPHRGAMSEVVSPPTTSTNSSGVKLFTSAGTTPPVSQERLLQTQFKTASELGFGASPSSSPPDSSERGKSSFFTKGSSQDVAKSSLTKPFLAVSGGLATSCEEAMSSQPSNDKYKPVVLRCSGKCRTWRRRKVLHSELLPQHPSNDLDLEKAITQVIYQHDTGTELDPIVFFCKLSLVSHPLILTAEVVLEQCTALGEFQSFLAFFKAFFPKFVHKNLTP